MNNIKPYEKYKPSGIEWLGEIPEHWEEFKPKTIGYLFGGLTGKSGDDFKIENETNVTAYIPFTNIANNFIIDKKKFAFVKTVENEKQNIVKKNDLLFLMSSENFEDIGKTSLLNDDVDTLYLNSFCKGFRIENTNFFPKFLNYIFSADVNRKRLSIEARGFTRINLKIGKVNDLAMFAPTSKEEQTLIANFLDYKLSKIDRFIRKKKQLIKLLNEQKAGIINQAVTKGIGPNVKMKDSGIEWLGDIPEHWKVKKLKYVTEVLRGKFTPRPRNDPKYYDGDYPFIQTGNITSTGKYIETYTQTLNDLGRDVSKEFPINTVVMSIAANIADVAILNFKACFPDSVIGFYPFNETDTDFLFYQLKNLRDEFYKIAIKSTQYNLNVDRVKNVIIFLPSLTEQKQIVSHIETETQKLNQTISTIEKEITLVVEYKTALIAEAVTGKIDVRNYEIPEVAETEGYEEVEEELSIAAEDAAEYQTIEE